MTVLQEGILAFLCAVGLTTVVWGLGSLALRRKRPCVPELLLVLPLRGEALAMEADVRELRRLQGSLSGAKIVLADCGLSADAKALAQYLAEREADAAFISAGDFHIT